MANKKQIAGYVTREEHRTIKAKAQSEDRSVSKWVAEAAKEKIERESLESKGQQYRIEQRLMGLVDDAADQAADRIIKEIDATGTDGESSDGGRLSMWGRS